MRYKLTRLMGISIFVEVTAHAPLEILGLADIDDNPVTIEILIYAGLFRQALQKQGNMFASGAHELLVNLYTHQTIGIHAMGGEEILAVQAF